MNVVSTQNNSNIKGIGGTANGKIVELHLTNREGTTIKINAAVVDQIATIKKKDKDRYDLFIRDTAEELKNIKDMKT